MTLATYLKVALISNYSEDVVLNDVKNYQKHKIPSAHVCQGSEISWVCDAITGREKVVQLFSFLFSFAFYFERDRAIFSGGLRTIEDTSFYLLKSILHQTQDILVVEVIFFQNKSLKNESFPFFYYL